MYLYHFLQNQSLAYLLLSLSLSANYTSYLHLEQSLALAHADIDDGKVLFVPWVETDFRTGEDPWWS
jgi:hypothetical protein